VNSFLRYVPGSVFLVLALWAGAAPAVQAQVSVAPVAVFMDRSEPFGTFFVSNQSGEAQEVSVGTRFGYPASDSLGRVTMRYGDSTAAERYSIGPSLRVFPEQFVLPPGERQIVRLTARPSPDREDGYYWTRLVTTATPQGAFEDTTAEEGIEARVQFRLRQVTAVLYKKGDPRTAVNIEQIEAAADSGRVAVTARIERGGNAPFLGRARLRIYDEGGTLVKERTRSLAAYFDLKRRFELPLPEEATAPGRYSAELRLSSERSDVPPAYRTTTDPVEASTAFTVK
jgi:P pilus assembly chaperone PapD